MKICVVGAGAIGGYLAVLLARSGNEVTVIARGPHLAAIREKGLRLVDHDGAEIGVAHVRATADMAEAGPQDLVLLTVKAHQVEAIADQLESLMQENTVIVPMQNGMPWWYFQRHGGEHEGVTVETVDPVRHHREHHRSGPHPRLRGLPGDDDGRAGRHQAHRR